MDKKTGNKLNTKKILINVFLIVLVVLFAIIPFFTAKDADFEGADTKAEEAIIEITPDYQPWFKPIFEPKSGEIESLLFALQAAIGAGFIGYYFGRIQSSTKRQVNKADA